MVDHSRPGLFGHHKKFVALVSKPAFQSLHSPYTDRTDEGELEVKTKQVLLSERDVTKGTVPLENMDSVDENVGCEVYRL